MSYLYSKLPEIGVPHRIGTGGSEAVIDPWLAIVAPLYRLSKVL